MDDDGESPRERYFELKLLALLPTGGSAREFAAWSRVLRHYAEWCESQAVLRVFYNDDEKRGTWSEAAGLLHKSRQAVHKRWAPVLKQKGLRAVTQGLIDIRGAWLRDGQAATAKAGRKR